MLKTAKLGPWLSEKKFWNEATVETLQASKLHTRLSLKNWMMSKLITKVPSLTAQKLKIHYLFTHPKKVNVSDHHTMTRDKLYYRDKGFHHFLHDF